jgi:hypothetical protein
MTQTATTDTLTVPLRASCATCGKEDGKNMRRGRCGRCARYFRQHGTERVRVQAWLAADPAQHETPAAQGEPESQEARISDEVLSLPASAAEQEITAATINAVPEHARTVQAIQEEQKPQSQSQSQETLAVPAASQRDRMVTLWTTAPASFDLAASREVGADCGLWKGQTVREVQTPLWHVYSQRLRYSEGPYAAMGAREWQQQQATPLGSAQAEGVSLPGPFAQALTVLRHLIAGGDDALRAALKDGSLKVRVPKTQSTVLCEGQKQRPLRLVSQVPEEIQARMVADRAAGLSYAKIDQKYGMTGLAKSAGHVAWSVCKAAARP